MKRQQLPHTTSPGDRMKTGMVAVTVAVMAATMLASPIRAPARDVLHATTLSAEEAQLKTYLLHIVERFNGQEIGSANSPGFTTDADFVNVEGTWMQGAEEIRRGHKMEAATKLNGSKITLLKLDIRFIRPDVAVVHQLHTMSGKRGPDGTLLPPHNQISTRVLVKEQGQWKTTAVQNSDVRDR